MLKRAWATSVGIACALFSCVASVQGAESAQIPFAVEAQLLPDSLNAWARQAGLQIIWPVDDDAGRLLAPRITGTFTPEAALRLLLRGSGLTYSFVDPYTVAIRHETTSPAKRIGWSEGGSPPQPAKIGQASLTRVAASSSDPPQERDVSRKEFREASAKEELEEVVVTGTHIHGVGPSSSPVVIYSRQDIERSGAVTVDQFVRQIPQNFALVNSNTSTGAGSGTNTDAAANVAFGSAVNLHGLGAGATLVLVNGHRLAPSGTDGSFVDISMIPLGAVERVEVLSDGASAIYGADAVAGVVNFILRKDFSGAETSALYGETSQGGFGQRAFSQLLGGSNGRTSATLTYDYSDQNPLRADQRTYIPLSTLGGNQDVLPEERRQSVFLTANQKLSVSTNLIADMFFSDRNFAADGNSFGTNFHTAGEVEQSAATLGLSTAFQRGWQVDANVSFAKQKADTDSTYHFEPDFVVHSENQSQLLSADLLASGSILSLPGGEAKISTGFGARREWFDDYSISAFNAGTGLDRDMASVYGEMFVPLVSDVNARRGVQRLELSLAARYDHYEQFGGSTNPKFGLLWTPTQGLSLRSTYATSFRVATLSQLSSQGVNYTAYPLPTVSGLDTNAIIYTAPGNPQLRPEKSESFTAGIDVQPAGVPGLDLSITYYRVRYKDRITQPPSVGGSIVFALLHEDVLSPFIDHSPDQAILQQIFASGPALQNPFELTADDIGATVDFRLQNIGKSQTSGLDVSATFNLDTQYGTVDLFLSGNYVFERKYQALSTTATADLLNTLFQPIDLHLRSGLTWSVRQFSSTLGLSYAAGYRNDLVSPEERMPSWTTIDAQFTYRPEAQTSMLLKDASISLNIQNLADRDPPLFNPGPAVGVYGFDAVNSSPLGRVITVSAKKRW